MTDTHLPRFSDGAEVLDEARRYGLGRVVGAPSRIGGEWPYTVRFEGANQSAAPSATSTRRTPPTLPSNRSSSAAASAPAKPPNTPSSSPASARNPRAAPPSTPSTPSASNSRPTSTARPCVLDSEDRRLLIAYEIGLGKTIEAGLILTELEARRTPDRVLVSCPSHLREKWHEELNRKFAQGFKIWSAVDIREYAHRVRQKPRRARMSAIAPLHGVRNEHESSRWINARGQAEIRRIRNPCGLKPIRRDGSPA